MKNEFEMLEHFFRKSDKERYELLLKNKKKRTKFVEKLAHDIVFDSKWMVKIEPSRQTSKNIFNILIEKGAENSCYVISCNSTLDSRTMPLDEALDKVVGFQFGTILCCISGKLLYYEGESTNERYIVEC